MLRKFAGNLILLLIANLLVKPVWILGIDRQVQNIVGPEEYGLYAALFNFSFLFSMVLDLGINQFANSRVAREPESIHHLFGQAFILKMGMALVYLVIATSAARLVGYRHQALGLFGFLALNQVLAGYLVFIRSHFNGLHVFKTDTLLSVLDKLLMIGLCTWLFYHPWGGRFELMHFAIAQTFCYVFTLGVGLLLILPKAKPHRWLPTWQWSKEALSSAFPYALLSVLMVVYMRTDMVMIERLYPQGDLEAGWYASAYRLLDALNMIAVLVGGLLFPMFSRLLAQRESPIPLLKLSSGLLFAAGITVSCAAIFLAEPIMNWLYPQNTPYQTKLFRILMWGFFPACLNYVFGTLLTAKGKLKWLNIASIGAIAFNLGCNAWFIPEYGAAASAYIALITHSALSIAYLLASQKYIGFAWKELAPIRLVKYVLWMVVGTWVFQTTLNWPVQLLLFSGWVAIGCFVSGLMGKSLFEAFRTDADRFMEN